MIDLFSFCQVIHVQFVDVIKYMKYDKLRSFEQIKNFKSIQKVLTYTIIHHGTSFKGPQYLDGV